MDLTLALSISGSINKTSVAVAVASLLGVALLALLFFAQAREVKRLREWASSASEREAELEARIVSGIRAQQARAAQLAQERPHAAAAVPRATPLVSRGAPLPPPAAAASATAITRIAHATDVTEGEGAVAGVRATSAGTAVPGLPVAGEASPLVRVAAHSAAEGAIAAAPAAVTPDAAASAASAASAAPAGAQASAAPAGAQAPAPLSAAAQPAVPARAGSLSPGASADALTPVGGVVSPPLAASPPDSAVSVSSQPLVEESASSRPARPPAPPAPRDSAAAPGLRGAAVTGEPRPSRRTVDVGGGSAQRRDAQAPSQSRPVGTQATIYRKERSASRTLAIVVGGVVLLVLVVVLLVSVVSSGSSNPPAPTRSASSHHANTVNVSSTKATLDVAVLNATETNGLAGQFANKLKGGGYAHARALYGTPSGTYPATTVQYAKGYQSEAMSVAHVIGVPASQVRPLLSATQPLAAGASVVVIVGQSAAGSEAAESSGAAESGEGTESSETPPGEATEGTTGAEGTEETAYGGEVPPESQTAEEGA